MKNFNPRSREGSDGFRSNKLVLHRDFNPRSREGSDTIEILVIIVNVMISIRAPARGATVPTDKKVWLINDFNPRSREGSDNSHQ